MTEPAVRTITGKPGGAPVLMEDARAPHQIRILHTGGVLTCTCTCILRGEAAGPVSQGSTLPTAGAHAAWLAWHAGKGVAV